MSSDRKRDAETDRLLRAVLKPASREPDAAAFETGTGACPDAGLLAAFVEGNLTAGEQSALDEHFAGCERCQASLAILSHGMPAEDVVPAETGWFTWVTRPRLRWVVPIGAAATVAIVFFATRPLVAPEGEVPASEPVQMAQAPSAQPGAAAVEPSAARDKLAAAPKDEVTAMAPPSEPAAKPAPGLPPRREEPVQTLADAAAGAQPARDAAPAEPAAEMAAARAVSEEKRTQPQAAAPPAPLAAASTAQPPAPAPAAVQVRTAAEAERAAPLAAGLGKNALSVQAAAVTVAGPGGKERWRLGPAGQIARSLDGGRTWAVQASGVKADLLAGAAPAPRVCWVVGTAGTVLLTVDGERWERRPFPVAVDLVAVEASGARAATVTARDGRRFETLDGGLTWTLK